MGKKKASLEDIVVEAAYELLKSHIGQGATRLLPRFPFCLLYILPRKEFMKGSIIIPEYEGLGSAAKITDEGIILRTWGQEKKIQIRRGDEDIEWTLKSEMSVGDHVLFHHWAGQPVPGTYVGDWTKSPFRFVKEYQNSGSAVWADSGGDTIFGKVSDGVDVDRVLAEAFIENGYDDDISVENCKTLKSIKDKLVLFPRDVRPSFDRRGY